MQYGKYYVENIIANVTRNTKRFSQRLCIFLLSKTVCFIVRMHILLHLCKRELEVRSDLNNILLISIESMLMELFLLPLVANSNIVH